ncbi:hypothetical protein Trydic_g1259 [Trypoxylus dichotomus]
MTDGDRSLSSGMSLPQWMKNRMNDRLNFDQNAFSPPENDDSFLYIRYNRVPGASSINNTTTTTNGQFTPKIEVVPKPLSTVVVSATSTATTDFSKHTAPCKKFIPNSVNVISEASKPLSGKIKSNGTDDGFKGEAAQCGSSVIRVAHQMVTGKLTRGASIPEEDFATEPVGFNKALRRGSKSLPSSPLSSPNTSPKSRRKHMNRYFSGALDTDKVHGSWILSGLLRKHDNLSRSVTVINEEESDHDTLTKSISQISIDEPTEMKTTKQKRAKPSELREMNFWSPTSM